MTAKRKVRAAWLTCLMFRTPKAESSSNRYNFSNTLDFFTNYVLRKKLPPSMFWKPYNISVLLKPENNVAQKRLKHIVAKAFFSAITRINILHAEIFTDDIFSPSRQQYKRSTLPEAKDPQ